MGLFSRRARPPASPTAITAASKQIAPTAEQRSDSHLKKVEGWQSRAWELYDEIGELRFAARYMGDALARLDLFVGIRPNPKDDPIPLEAEGDIVLDYTSAEAAAAMDALDRLSSPLGGRREIQRAFGVHLFVPGECFLVGEPRPSDYPDLEERWDVYSVDEVGIERRGDTDRVLLKAPGRGTTNSRELPEDTAAYRIWRPHPRFSRWSDSPVRASLGILEELSLLTQAIHSAATSRLKGPGVLFLPNSLRNGVNGPSQAGQATTEDQLVADFITAAGTAIKDQSSAFAQVPLVVYMDDERWAEMGPDKLLKWDQGVDEVMAKLRAELIQRFAMAIDLPPEILTGLGSVNHWSGWKIGDDAFRSHIEPLAMLLMDALTVNYLRPVLAQMGVSAPERFSLWYDPSNLVSDPDSGQRALDAHKEGLISDGAARRELGYSEDDAPDATDAPSSVPPDGGQDVPVDEQAPPVEQEPQQQPAAVVAAASDPSLDRLAARLNVADIALLRDAHQQADQVMRRALERANARLRSLAMKDATARTMVECVPSGAFDEAPLLGPALVRRLTAAEDDNAATEVLTLAMLARAGEWWDERLAAEADALLAELDLPEPAADQHRADLEERRTAGRLALMAGLVGVATRLLQRPEPGEMLGEADRSLVPPGIVRDALRTAGGGGEHAVSFHTGDAVEGMLREAGYTTTGFRWVYGPASWRHRPFPPHQALDGMEFADPDDERLGNPGYAWPGVSLYWPGDHPGCVPGWVPVSGPTATGASLREHHGEIVELALASGQLLAITPNHPVLTRSGWVPAGLLKEGDDVIRCLDPERAAALIPDDYQMEARIEDVAAAVRVAPGMAARRVEVAAEDFHGDGTDSDVAIVWTDRPLLEEVRNSSLLEPFRQPLLVPTDADLAFLAREGSPAQRLERVGAAALPVLRERRESLPFLGGPAGGQEKLRFAHRPGGYAVLTEEPRQRGPADADRPGDLLHRLASVVSADHVVRIVRKPFRGHVYNLETKVGWYLASGIVVHNCLCFLERTSLERTALVEPRTPTLLANA